MSLQIPRSERFPDYEKVQIEMLDELGLDELKALTEFLYGEFLGSYAVMDLIEQYSRKLPESSERAEIQKLIERIVHPSR